MKSVVSDCIRNIEILPRVCVCVSVTCSPLIVISSSGFCGCIVSEFQYCCSCRLYSLPVNSSCQVSLLFVSNFIGCTHDIILHFTLHFPHNIKAVSPGNFSPLSLSDCYVHWTCFPMCLVKLDFLLKKESVFFKSICL